MESLARWIQQTEPSIMLQTVSWMIPLIQTIHIVAIGVIVGSTLMIALRIVGVARADRSVVEVTQQFLPWALTALVVLLVSGSLLIVAEPMRTLTNPFFWGKMVFVVLLLVALLEGRRRTNVLVAANGPAVASFGTSHLIAYSMLAMLVVIILLGRWIAYAQL